MMEIEVILKNKYKSYNEKVEINCNINTFKFID